jgi:hypothetical protein
VVRIRLNDRAREKVESREQEHHGDKDADELFGRHAIGRQAIYHAVR